MRFEEKMLNEKKFIEENLTRFLPKIEGKQKKLFESMHYSINAGGKRLRPILFLKAFNLIDSNIERAIPYACAIEMIHTYSLIHDDLPAMDDDDYRRGILTNHVKFGEGLAILAGDGLLNYAFELMLFNALKDFENSIQNLKCINEIAKGSGVYGMIAGQTVDLESEGKKIDKETMHFIHNHKTGDLIEKSALAGIILANGDEKEQNAICNYAKNIGIAFQIVDDILDIVGDQKILGKPIGSDEEKNKATYPSIYGIEESRKMAKEYINKAKKSLDLFGEKAEFLRELAEYILMRDK